MSKCNIYRAQQLLIDSDWFSLAPATGQRSVEYEIQE